MKLERKSHLIEICKNRLELIQSRIQLENKIQLQHIYIYDDNNYIKKVLIFLNDKSYELFSIPT